MGASVSVKTTDPARLSGGAEATEESARGGGPSGIVELGAIPETGVLRGKVGCREMVPRRTGGKKGFWVDGLGNQKGREPDPYETPHLSGCSGGAGQRQGRGYESFIRKGLRSAMAVCGLDKSQFGLP